MQPPTSDYAALPRSAADHHAEAIGHAARAADLARQSRRAWQQASLAARRAAGVGWTGKWDPKALLQSARYDIEARDYSDAIDTATSALDYSPDAETAKALHEVIVRAQGLIGGAP